MNSGIVLSHELLQLALGLNRIVTYAGYCCWPARSRSGHSSGRKAEVIGGW